MHETPNTSGKQRVVIEGVRPEIDGGRFPVHQERACEICIEEG